LWRFGFLLVCSVRVLEERKTCQVDEASAPVALNHDFLQPLAVDFWLKNRVGFLGVVVW
jgi:hypothetical protein